MEFLKIDGSYGEGGGQIIRTAITLSCITKKPIIIENIRQKRKVPGLRPQHLTAVRILKKICSAEVEGDRVGSTEIKFIPREVNDCNLREDIKTAGSISLVLQVLIPSVAICKKRLALSISGGTDVLWSPTIDYTKDVVHEAYSRMGINFSLNVIRRGYYPRGGGVVELQVEPIKTLYPLALVGRQTRKAKILCTISQIPRKGIEEQLNRIRRLLSENGFVSEIEIVEEMACDAGGSVLISSMDDSSIVGIDYVLDKKVQSIDDSIIGDFVNSCFGVDDHLADMLVVPASLIDGLTTFRVKNITKHLETNLHVASEITGCKYGVGKIQDGYEIRIQGVLGTGI